MRVEVVVEEVELRVVEMVVGVQVVVEVEEVCWR